MPPSVAGTASGAAERTAATIEAIRNKMPTNNRAEKVEAKYDVVLDFPNLELHSAAASGNVGLVHYALTHGQPVNSLLHGCLPLHAACSGGSVSVVRMLIENGADVNAPRLPRRYSQTKSNGANSNTPAVGTSGSTPLHFAAANGHANVVEILLASGAVAGKPDKNGMTPEDLAEMSGHAEVLRALRVWLHLNETDSEVSPSDSKDRPFSMGSDFSDPGPSRKGKERSTSMVSMASEKARLIRSSFESGFRNISRPPTSPPSNSAASEGSNGTIVPTEAHRAAMSAFDSDFPSSEQPSPIPASPISLDGDAPPTLSPGGAALAPTDSPETPPPAPSPSFPHRSSRRPSLPSILERAAHPGVAFRSALKKTGDKVDKESSTSTSMTETDTSPTNHTSLFRGRSRAKVSKESIKSLFRRGHHSPPSRSPSPPRKTEPTRVIRAEELDEGIARIKRASLTMDAELLQMSMDAAALSDQLEAAVTTSAPVTKTRFFEEVSPSPSFHSVASERTAPADRPWNQRNGVISPSPLANEWSSEHHDFFPSGASVRRTRTEIRRPPQHAPRRMPSTPAMPSYIQRKSVMIANDQAPASPDASSINSPAAGSSDAEAAAEGDDERDLASSIDTSNLCSVAHAPEPSKEAANDQEIVEPEAALSPLPQADTDSRQFPGESTGSLVTMESSRGIVTPPSSGLKTPPESQPVEMDADRDMKSLGLISEANGRPRVRSDASAVSAGSSTNPASATCLNTPPSSVILGSGFPPVPEHEEELSSRPGSREGQADRPGNRKISSHREARDVLEKTERDVLELAGMPATLDSSRSLADQLAAYGDSHALAQEFARAEGLSSVSGSSGERMSWASGSSGGKVHRRSSGGHRHSRLGNASPTLTPIDPSRSSVSSVSNIYDRRAAAYRDRLQALTTAPPIQSMRTGSSIPPPRSRAGSGSDTWLDAGPGAVINQRRMTDPSRTRPSTVEEVDQHPHISGPIPLVSDTQVRRSDSRGKVARNLPSKAQITSTLPSKATIASTLPSKAQIASTFKPSSASSSPLSSTPGMGLGMTPRGQRPPSRANSLTRPNSDGVATRYQGLAQAQAFTASSHHSSVFSNRHHVPHDGVDSDDSGERQQAYTVIANDWRGGHVVDYDDVKSSKWVQIKGAIGHLRR